jgi:ubiquinone/menaquinone biosynthesis C-methylase UbiE
MKKDLDQNGHYKKTQEFFDRSAAERGGLYDLRPDGKSQCSKHILVIRKKLSKIFEQLKTKNNLDVGCGNGDFFIELAKIYPNLNFTGVDFSGEMIRTAKNIAAGIKNIKFDVGDVLSLQFADKFFDTVFCVNTLHHISPEDQRRAFKELARVAGENVIVEIKNWDHPYHKYLRTGFGRYKINVQNQINVYPTTVKAVEANMREFGFELVRVKPLWHFVFLSPFIVLHFKRIGV